MKCKFCGGTRFIGHQICRMDVLVGEDGSFLDNRPGGAEANIYDSQRPYGPFTCQGCGAEYEDLQDGTEPSCGPAEDWQPMPFKKKLDFMRGKAARYQQWEDAHYELSISFYETGLTTIQVHKKSPMSRYLPALYVGNASDDLPNSVSIQTTSYGTLPPEETEKLCAALRIAIETARGIEIQFIQPIRSGAFQKGEFMPRSPAPSDNYSLPDGSKSQC